LKHQQIVSDSDSENASNMSVSTPAIDLHPVSETLMCDDSTISVTLAPQCNDIQFFCALLTLMLGPLMQLSHAICLLLV
jgi:hypothetical protein